MPCAQACDWAGPRARPVVSPAPGLSRTRWANLIEYGVVHACNGRFGFPWALRGFQALSRRFAHLMVALYIVHVGFFLGGSAFGGSGKGVASFVVYAVLVVVYAVLRIGKAIRDKRAHAQTEAPAVAGAVGEQQPRGRARPARAAGRTRPNGGRGDVCTCACCWIMTTEQRARKSLLKCVIGRVRRWSRLRTLRPSAAVLSCSTQEVEHIRVGRRRLPESVYSWGPPIFGSKWSV